MLHAVFFKAVRRANPAGVGSGSFAFHAPFVVKKSTELIASLDGKKLLLFGDLMLCIHCGHRWHQFPSEAQEPMIVRQGLSIL